MSALRIMQMGGMTLKMHSQNWEISPTEYDEMIDGKPVTMLGYDYEIAEDDGITRLELVGVAAKYESVLKEALLDFFYPENELFGSLLGKGDRWEIYGRSEKEIPCRQYSTDLKGVLYFNNLARGRLDLPIIVNIRKIRYYDSRSRETFTNSDSFDELHEVLCLLDANTSITLLKMLYSKWNEYPKDHYDINTKYYMVCQLVRNVSKDPKLVQEFQREYKDLAYIERKKDNISRNRVIDETIIWARKNNQKRLVNPIFRLLGAVSLVDIYLDEKDRLYKEPTCFEHERVKILYLAAKDIIPVLLTDTMPEVVITENENEVFHTLQFSEKCYDSNKAIRNRKYKILKLVFKHSDFSDDAYNRSLMKMCEALLHVYGTDRSETFTASLTYLGGWMLERMDIVYQYKKAWTLVKER